MKPTPAQAEMVRDVLGLLGPRPRERILRMLEALGCSEAEAEEVVAHALAQGWIEIDPASPETLRARAERPRGSRLG